MYSAVAILLSLVVFGEATSVSPDVDCAAPPALLKQDSYRSASTLRRPSLIKDYASVGDSYSAGIGAGDKHGGWGDYFCSRHDASFPTQLNLDTRLGDPANRTFTYRPCSGATTDEVIEQVQHLKNSSQDIITVTSGGNDAHLSDILNECIFQWYSGARYNSSLCGEQLQRAQDVIDSSAFHAKLDKLISAAKRKLKPEGSVYYVGYAQFFGQEDRQCDNITWAFMWEYAEKEYLTKDKRVRMNALVRSMNKVLQEAVGRAGPGVTFIDYDKYVVGLNGRFCEASHPETNGNRNGLLFYEWGTDDNKPPTDGHVRQEAPTSLQVTPDLVMNGTFMGRINDHFRRALDERSIPGPAISLSSVSNTPISIDEVKPTEDQIVRGYSTNVVPDTYGRVFHPRPDGHAIIANLIAHHIATKQADSSDSQLLQHYGRCRTPGVLQAT